MERATIRTQTCQSRPVDYVHAVLRRDVPLLVIVVSRAESVLDAGELVRRPHRQVAMMLPSGRLRQALLDRATGLFATLPLF